MVRSMLRYQFLRNTFRRFFCEILSGRGLFSITRMAVVHAMATVLIMLAGGALAVTPRSLKAVSKREIPLYGDVFPSFAAGLSPWAKYASAYSLGGWASPPKSLSPTPSEVAHAIAVAKQASANVVIAQQQVQAAKENVLNQQKTAMDKETAAALLTQKSEAAAAIQRSEAASAAQAVVLAQQRLAAAKASVAKQQQIAAAKEADAAAALQRAALAAAEEIKRTEHEASKYANIHRTGAAAAAHHLAATKDAALAPLTSGNNHVPNLALSWPLTAPAAGPWTPITALFTPPKATLTAAPLWK